MQHGLGGQVARSKDDFAAARAAIEFVQQDTDLDARLQSAASAECAAFCCLLDTKLSEALRYSMWCEWASLSQLAVRHLNSAVQQTLCKTPAALTPVSVISIHLIVSETCMHSRWLNAPQVVVSWSGPVLYFV